MLETMNQDDLHIQSGMKVPPSYFDDFKANLLKSIEMESVFPTKDGFAVPENYFEASKSTILKATVHKPKKVSLWRYVAAAVLAVLLVSSVWIYTSVNQLDNVQFSDLTSSEIHHYLDNAYFDDKSYLILEQLQTVDLNNLTAIENQYINNIEAYMSEYDYKFEDDY